MINNRQKKNIPNKPPARGKNATSKQVFKPKLANAPPVDFQSGDEGKIAHLPKHTSDYARSLANPYQDGPTCGIPAYPTTLSAKQKVWIKGTFQSGTGGTNPGYGGVTFNPWMMYANDAGVAPIVSTTAAYDAARLPISTDSGVVSLLRSNSQYVAAQFGTGYNLSQARLVSAGLRIRYAGTSLNRGGVICGLCDPTHDDVGGRTMNQLEGELTSVKMYASQSKWSSAQYRPVITYELDYSGKIETDFRVPIICFLVTSPDSSISELYEFEAFANFEYQGRNIRGMGYTPSDPVGFAAVSHATQVSPHLQPSQASNAEREGGILGHVAKYVTQGITHVSTHAPAYVTALKAAQNQVNGGGSWMDTIWNGVRSAAPIALKLLSDVS